jgi:glycosyltransferase involved in cell wall biosynthesis
MKKFAIVIPSYKNKKWCKKNIESALNQKYSDYRIIFMDDCSPDGTAEEAEKVISNHQNKDKVTLIKNDVRCGALKNLYDMIHSCDDDEIVVTLDGDDWLASDEVLSKLDSVYSKQNVWMTYGSYINWPGKSPGCARPYEINIIQKNMFRKAQWRASHLRTFYSWLFKKIKKQDFMDPQGRWLDMAWDLAFMLPMLEMCGDRFRYLKDIHYIYNNENPISDFRVNVKRQGMLDRFIRSKPKYNRL